VFRNGTGAPLKMDLTVIHPASVGDGSTEIKKYYTSICTLMFIAISLTVNIQPSEIKNCELLSLLMRPDFYCCLNMKHLPVMHLNSKKELVLQIPVN
jgi:hypothetical protein